MGFSLQVPVVGQPHATEDVKVGNDLGILQGWGNGNILGSDLSPTAAITRAQMAGGFGNLIVTPVSVDTSAVDGRFYEVTATGHQITLPAPTINATVGVGNFASGGLTTIVRSGSAVIIGVGVSLTSIQLGTPNACVVLVADGANWLIVSGQQDWGWVALTLSNCSATGAPYDLAQARLVGNQVQWRGGVTASSNGACTASAPAGFAPSGQLAFPVPNVTNSSLIFGLITTGGVLTFTGISGQVYSLGNVRYSTS